MMKIFIDLGAYNGDTLKCALKWYKNFDKFYAFEPLTKNFNELKKNFGNTPRIFLFNAAADIVKGESKLYSAVWDSDGSLCCEKINCFKDKTELVKTIDISKFIIDNFTPKDKIVLKIDIEGKEYDILEKMIEDGSIKYIDTLFCEWHYNKINLSQDRHEKLIQKLNKFGFGLTGERRWDDFACVFAEWRHTGKLRFYIKRRLRLKHSKLYFLLKAIKQQLAATF